MKRRLILEYRIRKLEKSILKNVKQFESALYEAKQVGTLYHVCTLESYIKYIQPTDTLQASGTFKNKLYNNRNYVSFTRNQRFVIHLSSNSNIRIQLVVDGDKLSENYKIAPYNYWAFPLSYRDIDSSSDSEENNAAGFVYDKPSNRQDEEVVKGPIKNLSRYLKEVRIDFVQVPNDKDIELLEKYKQQLNECVVYYPFIRDSISKGYGVFTKLHAGDKIEDIISYYKDDSNVEKEASALLKSIKGLDYESASELLLHEAVRDYFQKYGESTMRDLVNIYKRAFDTHSGKCDNVNVINTFKAIVNSDVDVTKFTYLDEYGNGCNIFRALPKYGPIFDREESEVAEMIRHRR